jgi:uncharacterized surface protein with fasciclin (FAS1) repeats
MIIASCQAACRITFPNIVSEIRIFIYDRMSGYVSFIYQESAMYPKHLLSAFLIAVLLMVPSATVFAQEESIADIAADNDDLSTLVAALTVAELVEALDGDGPFTVFAPTNEAFAALPAGMSDEWVAGEAEELTDVLLYHVLPEVMLAEDISDGLQAETLQGEFVVFSVDGDSISINDADIIATDILANNGVIHVINRVLLLPQEEVLNDEPVEEVAEEAIDEEVDDEDAETAEVDDEEIDEVTDDTEADDEELAEIADDADAPSVTADDQTSDGTIVTVSSVTAAQSGWMVIHLDADGRPGPVIGQTAVPAGTTDNVIVFLDEDISGETALWAMLHVDEGQPGVYEFPGPDVPVTVNDTIVMAPFTASAPEVVVEEEVIDEEAVEEEEVVEEEAVDEEEVVEEEAVEDEVDDEEMVEEEEAPETLPATGSGMTGAPLAVTAAALVVLVLAAGAALSRRRFGQI